ncbi:MAG: hypothetical protein IPJ94_20950 [Chloroflexi bacterium]|nr:hypothetical protein [Chloroflexota bacterium]
MAAGLAFCCQTAVNQLASSSQVAGAMVWSTGAAGVTVAQVVPQPPGQSSAQK